MELLSKGTNRIQDPDLPLVPVTDGSLNRLSSCGTENATHGADSTMLGSDRHHQAQGLHLPGHSGKVTDGGRYFTLIQESD